MQQAQPADAIGQHLVSLCEEARDDDHETRAVGGPVNVHYAAVAMIVIVRHLWQNYTRNDSESALR